MFTNGIVINQMDQSIRYLIVTILFLFHVNFPTADANVKLAPTIRLNNGYEMPVIGLGTFLAKGADCEQAVKDAIDLGYRHIDTAYFYGNEKEVGNAVRAKIAEGVIKREDIFITTKLWSTFHKHELFEKAFEKTFTNLNLQYIDLYLMHTAMSYQAINKDGSTKPILDVDEVDLLPQVNGKTLNDDTDYLVTWRLMEKLVGLGKVRSIGISNFNSEQVERLNSLAEIKPVNNQVECHPNLNQRKLIKFCADRNITVTAYSPVGRPHLAGKTKKPLAIFDPRVQQLAEKYNKTKVQIILRYLVQNGVIIVPKSTNKQHIKENFEIFDFELDQNDMETIHSINSDDRLVPFDADVKNIYYPFKIEF